MQMDTMKSSASSTDTYFASPDRVTRAAALQTVQAITRNPVIDTLLRSVGGLLAVLNEHRQIVSVNDAFLKALGISDAQDLFGMRPGEAMQCVHSRDMPAGCGTSRFCSSCGAAISVVSTLSSEQPDERDCVVPVTREGAREELFFRVRSDAITIGGQRFVLVFLQDMTEHQRRATLERVFLHDFKNLLAGLVGHAEMFDENEDERPQIAEQIVQLSMRLAKEIEVHAKILSSYPCEIRISRGDVSICRVAKEIELLFCRHPAAAGKTLMIDTDRPDCMLWTDHSLLLRVLANAVTNAFEASAEGDTVRVWYEATDDGVTFHVWNPSGMPEAAAMRMFQMSFSTKGGTGRGIGTYMMRLITERYLGGRADFTTSSVAGTEFCISLPYELPECGNPPAG